MNRTIKDFYMMEAMKYYSNEDTTNKKRLAMINNENNEFMASRKNDGCWSMLIHESGDVNHIRSRSISVKTGAYGDYTNKLPHICEEMDKLLPDNTVILAEICWDEPGTTANTVGTILRCKDAKAVERQEEHKLKAVAFDCLMWNGEDLTNTPYVDRVNKFLFNINGGINLYPTTFFSDNFAEAADDIIGHGGEGVVIQRKDATYTPGLRSAWKTLKLKQQLPEMELRVLGVIEPNKLYEGISGDNWPYILNGEKVTKPYYMGWKTGVTVDYNGIEVGVTSGTTDEDKEWLASDEAAELIKAGKLIAVVKGMAENSQGSIRHPILIRLRNDLS